MNIYRKYTLMWAAILLLPTIVLQAQKPSNPKPVAKPAVPVILPDTVKVPKFTVKFGFYDGSSPAILDDLKRLLGGSLTVTDQQGQKWNPLEWRFVWNRLEETDDIRTGKRKTIKTYNAVDVDSTGMIPATWQAEMKEFLTSGEEISFESIIIEHPGSKRKMLAPDLRIKVR